MPSQTRIEDNVLFLLAHLLDSIVNHIVILRITFYELVELFCRHAMLLSQSSENQTC